MSKIKEIRKRIPLSTTALLLLLVIVNVAVAGTMAYLNHKPDEVVNLMYPGHIGDIKIVEDFDKPGGDTDNDTKKTVAVENDAGGNGNTVPVYTRMALAPVFRLPAPAGGSSLAGNVSFDGTGNIITVTSPDGATVFECVLASNWEQNWFYKNGFFYHKKMVNPGQTSATLLQSVSKNAAGTWDNFEIEVLAEAVQTDGSVEEALKIWNVSRSGNELTK